MKRPLMNTSAILIAGALILLGGIASADPPVPVDPALGTTALLRYQFEPGRVDTYTVSIDQQLDMGGAALGMNATTLLTMSMDTQQTVTDLNAEGNGTIEQVISNTSVTMTVNDQPFPADDFAGMLNGLEMTMVMNALGTVLDTQIGDVSDPQMQQAFGMFEESFGQMTVQFPEGEVAVGDSWQQDVPLDMEQPGMDLETRSTAAYTFLGYAMVGGVQCAVLQSDVSIEMSGEINEMGIETTANGSGSGSGYTYFDNTSGTLVQGSMSMTLNTIIDAGGMGMNQDLTMTMTIRRH